MVLVAQSMVQYEFWDSFFYICEECHGVLIGIALNLYIALGIMDNIN
jgi:hypothetical protein